MVDCSCKALSTEGGEGEFGGGNVKEGSITFERDTRKKKGQKRRIASVTINVGQREKRGNFSTKSAYIHRFAIFSPFQFKGNKMTTIYQRGAHSSVDRYPITELFSNREIGGSECFKSLNMVAFDKRAKFYV